MKPKADDDEKLSYSSDEDNEQPVARRKQAKSTKNAPKQSHASTFKDF